MDEDLSDMRLLRGPPPLVPLPPIAPPPPGPCMFGGMLGDLAAAVRADRGVWCIPVMLVTGRPANPGKGWPKLCMAAARLAAAEPGGGLGSLPAACQIQIASVRGCLVGMTFFKQ